MPAKQFYATIDTETCTLPEIKAVQGDKAGLNFPLVYDLGVVITDRDGTVFHRQSWIIAETFSNIELFNTGYYAWKRPIYEAQIKRGETKVETWNNASFQLLQILERFNAIACAYNAQFDFKKAFHCTNKYVRCLYKPNGKTAVAELVASILTKSGHYVAKKKAPGEEAKFWLVDKWFPIIDIWAFACFTLFQTPTYKKKAVECGWFSQAGNFTTNAETAYRYIIGNDVFDEDHTALSDAIIEAEILAYIFKHHHVTVPYGLYVNPWQKVGKIPK